VCGKNDEMTERERERETETETETETERPDEIAMKLSLTDRR